MNYWPAETTGLPECHEPLLDYVEHLAAGRPSYGAGAVRLRRLDGAPQRRRVVLDDPGRGRSAVVELADGGRLAVPASVGPLRVHR